MLTLEQISNQFPLSVRQINPRGMLVEYLQYEVLDSLFKDPAAAALSFMGGTAIRVLHNSPRFSEDLDFDNFRLSFEAFEKLLKAACRDMEYKGFVIEYRGKIGGQAFLIGVIQVERSKVKGETVSREP